MAKIRFILVSSFGFKIPSLMPKRSAVEEAKFSAWGTPRLEGEEAAV